MRYLPEIVISKVCYVFFRNQLLNLLRTISGVSDDTGQEREWHMFLRCC